MSIYHLTFLFSTSLHKGPTFFLLRCHWKKRLGKKSRRKVSEVATKSDWQGMWGGSNKWSPPFAFVRFTWSVSCLLSTPSLLWFLRSTGFLPPHLFHLLIYLSLYMNECIQPILPLIIKTDRWHNNTDVTLN